MDHIIIGCKKGRESAFRALYIQFGPVLLALAARYSRDMQEAEDILQESFIKIYRKINSFNNEGSFEGWLKRVVINTSLNKVKKNNQLKEDEIKIEIENHQHYSSNLDEEYLLQCLQKLPEGYRTIFNLYVMDGYNHKEIAEMMGISEGTSKSQLSKAKVALKQIVNKEELWLP